MRLHQSTIEAVRERASIVDLLSSKKLKKVGAEFVTQCPWHADKRPSLTISPAKNFAFCHVCAKGVDAIGWIQDQQGLSFTDAVMNLANRYGVEVKAESEEDQERWAQEQVERREAFEKAEILREKFQEKFPGSPAEAYLLKRGLNEETIAEWRLGWSGSRVMFPLDDAMGRTVAFTGRALGDEKPKYKNSPNGLIYTKAEMVFGLSRAREEIVRSGQVVVVEGQMDVISCWQHGVRNMVAVSGSSLTQEMIEKILRQAKAKEVVLCFDGDVGGMKAADRALRAMQSMALAGDVTLRILTMPEGCDPADLADAMGELISDAQHWVEWWFDRETSKVDLSDPQELMKAEAGVKRILQVLPTGSLREYVKRRSSEVLKAVPNVPAARVLTRKEIDRCQWAERRALRLYLHDPGCRPAISTLNFSDPLIKEAWNLIQVLEGMLPAGREDLLHGSFAEVIQRADEKLLDCCRALVRPIPDVARIILANPINELEGAMEVLTADPCCEAQAS